MVSEFSSGQKILIILGMHRSGTSLTAQWLHACGLNLGDDLYKASEFNPNGYFEDTDFLNLHRRLLQENGIHHSGHDELKKFSLTKKQLKEVEELLTKKKRSEQWGWKEPRTCLFVNYYMEMIPNGVFLVVFRDWREVVTSLMKREEPLLMKKSKITLSNIIPVLKKYREKRKKIKKYLKIWITYNSILLNALENFNGRVIVTDYHQLQKNDKRVFLRLEEYGFKLKYVPFKEIFEEGLLTNRKLLRENASYGKRKKISAIYSRFEMWKKKST